MSTEKLCSEVESVNERITRDGVRRGPFQRTGKLIVGSKIVKAHYPEMDVEVAAEEAKLETEESDLEVATNTEELALFLACTMSQEEIDGENLSRVVHRRRFRNGARPGLTCKAITAGSASRLDDKLWLPPARSPTRTEKMRMVDCLVRSATRWILV